MSIIQQLRDKAAVLLTGLIALSLIGFLVQDAFIGRTGGLFEGNTQSVGSINGKSIDVMEFNSKVTMAEQGYRNQGMQTNEMMTQNIVESIWNGYVQEELIRSEADRVGISLTSRELGNLLFSDNAPQEFKQLFTDPQTGQYNVQAARNWFNNLKKSKKAEDIRMVNDQLINPMNIRLLTEKYSSFFNQGAYVPKWLIEKQNADNSSFAGISYVAVPYATVSDSMASVRVEDKEIEAYVAQRKDQFKQEKSRSVAYVVFDANPTALDSSNLLNQMLGLKPDFEAAADARAFVTRNSTTLPFYDGYVLKSRLQMSAKDNIIALSNGTTYGPYLDGGSYVLAKKIDTRMMPDTVRCRHILIGTVDPATGQARLSDTLARKRADSIMTALGSGSNFALLAAGLSDDQGSKMNGGEYTFSSVDMNLAPEFRDFIFYRKPGDRDIVKTSFGYHIIEVLQQKNFEEGYKIAYLAKRILASPETDNAAASAATQFAGNSRDAKSFEANLTKSGLNKRIADNVREMDYNLSGMPSRSVVKWIFENKPGTVSEPIDMKDSYIVVLITGGAEEGVQSADAARPFVESILKNKKKAAEIARKAAKASTLEAIATATSSQVSQVDTIRYSDPFVPNLGSEPSVIGAAFNKNFLSKVSGAIEGQNAVYFIKVNRTGALAAVNAAPTEQKRILEQQMRQTAMYSTMEALRNAAKIKDTRRQAGY